MKRALSVLCVGWFFIAQSQPTQASLRCSRVFPLLIACGLAGCSPPDPLAGTRPLKPRERTVAQGVLKSMPVTPEACRGLGEWRYHAHPESLAANHAHYMAEHITQVRYDNSNNLFYLREEHSGWLEVTELRIMPFAVTRTIYLQALQPSPHWVAASSPLQSYSCHPIE